MAERAAQLSLDMPGVDTHKESRLMPQDVGKANHALAQEGHKIPFDSDVLSMGGSGTP